MPDVSFYILPSHSELDRLRFACKLAEKAYRAENKVYMLTDSESQSQKLDDLLWTFRAGSFVPHNIYTESISMIENRVIIGLTGAPENWQQTIINLSNRCPENLDQSERVLEILDNDETIKQSGRKRYRLYQQSRFKVNTFIM